MAVVCNPNHPMLVNRLFQSGPAGTGKNDYKVQLRTNTALNNKLKEGSTYCLSGRMIALANRSPPIITYGDTSVSWVIDSASPPPNMINKTNVTVAHNDWDVVVSSVSVTSGHKTSRSLAASVLGATPSPRTGRNFVKFSSKSDDVMLAPVPKAQKTPFEAAASNAAKASTRGKGKAKAMQPESEDESSSVKYGGNGEEFPPTPVTPPPAKRGQLCIEDLIAAAKKMQRE
ncbi:hypothetical protein PCANC_26682 [Puccinia coronata f. sp. avenae]|uniref:Uncharacterized protein n=1 Tax=Puccinia coronata f. sp. avenae TaxID=200324 RepID=A0A2N5S771_9BASI|nr:hypothetical protein PCANC_26682 [Puccinia coronata f. sp. avenae]